MPETVIQSMLHYLTLGIIQGIFEWLPVSSEGIVTLAAAYMGIANPLQLALYLHLGTVLAVLVYFRKDVKKIFEFKDKKLARFLTIATIVSLFVSFPFYLLLKTIVFDSPIGFLLVGIALILTGFFVHKKKGGLKTIRKTTDSDALLAGALQGFAVIPGISRSGITLFALLSEEYSPESALTLSFLMSVPVVLVANAFILLEGFTIVPEHLLALIPSFVFGIITIRVLLDLSKKVRFSWFAWIFGAISILAYLIA